VSESSRRDIDTHMGVPAERIEVIPVGIDPDEFRPPPQGQTRDPDSNGDLFDADPALAAIDARGHVLGNRRGRSAHGRLRS
jgi:glycosyltransferase involved in cell wall biosynthesis